MASNTSKTARASVRAGQAGQGGALSVLGEFKYLIPLGDGKFAYVRNLTNGKTAHLRTDSDAFVEEIRVLAAAGHGAKIRAEIDGLAGAHPRPRLGRHREAPRRRRRLRGLTPSGTAPRRGSARRRDAASLPLHVLRVRTGSFVAFGDELPGSDQPRELDDRSRAGSGVGAVAGPDHRQQVDPAGVEVVDRTDRRRPGRRRPPRPPPAMSRSRRTVRADVHPHRLRRRRRVVQPDREHRRGDLVDQVADVRRPGAASARSDSTVAATAPQRSWPEHHDQRDVERETRRTRRSRAPPGRPRDRRSAPRRSSRTSGRRSPPTAPGSRCSPARRRAAVGRPRRPPRRPPRARAAGGR